MKSPIKIVAVAIVLAAPVVSFAQQSPQSLTRAQVRAGVIQAAQSGYSPLDWADFPYGEYQAALFRNRVRNAGESAGMSGATQGGEVAR